MRKINNKPIGIFDSGIGGLTVLDRIASKYPNEEYFYLGGISVIEWAENIKELLPDNTIYLNFTINPDTTRNVEIKAPAKFIQLLEANL